MLEMTVIQRLLKFQDEQAKGLSDERKELNFLDRQKHYGTKEACKHDIRSRLK